MKINFDKIYKINGHYTFLSRPVKWLNYHIVFHRQTKSCKSYIEKIIKIFANVLLAAGCLVAYPIVTGLSLVEAGAKHTFLWIKTSLLKKRSSSTSELSEYDKKYLKNTDPRYIGALYQTMKVVDEVFRKHGITYWLECGSALGFERHGTIIPWDDDVDVHIQPGHEEKILNQKFLNKKDNRLKYDQRKLVLQAGKEVKDNGDVDKLINAEIQKDFNKYGLKIAADNWQGFKVFPIKCPSFGKEFHCGPTAGWTTTPHLDVFVTKKVKEGNRVKFDLTKRAKQVFPRDYFYEDEVFPLRRVKFGPIEVFTANNNKPHLDREYGKDWSKVAYRTHSHIENKRIKKHKVEIRKFEPAKYEFPYEQIPMNK